jgi:hypothetical protein
MPGWMLSSLAGASLSMAVSIDLGIVALDLARMLVLVGCRDVAKGIASG